MKKKKKINIFVKNNYKHRNVKNDNQRIDSFPTFFFSGSSLYFLERILVRSRLLISGCNFAYLALFSMKKRKYGVRGFLGKSGCFCVSQVKTSTRILNLEFDSDCFSY